MSWPCSPASSIGPERLAVAREPAIDASVAPSDSRIRAVKLSSVCAVRMQLISQLTRSASSPLSRRTRSKLCTPVCMIIPPPATAGSSIQPGRDGSKRWLMRSECRRPICSRASSSGPHHAVVAQGVRHHHGDARFAARVQHAPAFCQADGRRLFQQHRPAQRCGGLDDLAMQRRWHHHDDGVDVGGRHQIAIVSVSAAAEFARLLPCPARNCGGPTPPDGRSGSSWMMWRA